MWNSEEGQNDIFLFNTHHTRKCRLHWFPLSFQGRVQNRKVQNPGEMTWLACLARKWHLAGCHRPPD